jgi:hypothetical protein
MTNIATPDSELAGRAFSIQARSGLADRAREFIPDGELNKTILAVYNVTLLSLLAERAGRRIYVAGEVTQAKVRERMKLGFDLYATLRDPKQFGLIHRKAIDHLPMVIRCELDNEPWDNKISDRGTWNADALQQYADDAAKG